jgi:S-adenosylmethionine decarboxylase
MKNIAPNIKRQRLLIEGYYSITVEEETIRCYFDRITESLNLKTYGNPIIFSPSGMGKEENQGYDAFVPLIDSGISLYVWSKEKFVSIIIYTCKDFNEAIAAKVTKDFFKLNESAQSSF